jgi:hypothetical protein
MFHQSLPKWFVNRLVHYPERILMAVSGICLLIFLVTIPLPRIDNQLIGSDGVYYYVYLPSLLLDGNLDFTNEYTYFFASEPAKVDRIINNRTSQGIPSNVLPVGPALLWMPFFLLAHLLAHLFNLLGANIPTNGYGYFYQAFVLSGSILYGGAGLWFSYRFVRELSTREAALFSTVLIAFGGNLVYYMTAEPSMAHAPSAFASALFFYTWLQHRDRPGVKTATLYGLLGGLMALIRFQDGLFLILPFLAQLPAVWLSLRGQSSPDVWQGWLRDILLAGVVALFIFSPQIVIWGEIYGTYFLNPYTYQNRFIPYTYQNRFIPFHWLSPRVGAVLFSASHGLFTWHPIFLLALLGLLFTYRRGRLFATLGFLGFVMQWYLISSWRGWSQGDAFGGRMFIVCTPIFALGLASLIERVVRRWSWSTVYVVGSLLLVWNFLLFVEYRFDLVTARRPPTWYDLTVGRLTFLTEHLLEH